MKNKVKIIGIISGSRKQGLGATLTNIALTNAKKQGADVELIYLFDENLHFCTGCLTCMKLGYCHLDDSFESLKHKLYEADGIILTSPTYCGTYNAVMKNLFERLGLYERLTSNLSEKYIVGISTAGGRKGAEKTANQMVTLITNGIFARSYNSGILGSVSRPAEDLAPKYQEQKNLDIKKASLLGKKIFDDIKNKKHYYFQNIPHRLLARFLFKPLYTKFVFSHRYDFTKAIYSNLMARKILK